MNQVSLFTPTKNRPEFVSRILKYYLDVGFQGQIIIGDSSDLDNLNKTKSYIQKMGPGLDVTHHEMPGLNGVQCVEKLIELIPTPYAAFVADDDYMVPSALYQCAAFLEGNPEYSAAHGLGLLFSVLDDAPHGQIKDAGYFRQPILEGETASARLTGLFHNYAVTLFSVKRLSTWQSLYKDSASIADWRRFGGELLQCGRTAMAGNIKQLDCLQLVRQVHQPAQALTDKKNNQSDYSAINMSSTSTEDSFSWLANPDWSKSYEEFHRLISDEMASRDNIDVDQAQALVKRVFWRYLADVINQNWNAKFRSEDTHLKPRIKRAARSFPGIQWVYQQMKSTTGNSKVSRNFSIEVMIKPSSTYHQDFMPIHRSITSKVEAPIS